MIKLLSAKKEETNNQLYLTIQIDAKAADIISQDQKGIVGNEISKHLVILSNAITLNGNVDYIEQEFRKFLRDILFKHYVNMTSINDFIYDIKKIFVAFRDNVIMAGYSTIYEFINYEGE